MKQDYFELQQKVEQDKFTNVLDQMLNDQVLSVLEFPLKFLQLSIEEIPFQDFFDNFEELSRALKTTMHRLPLHNVTANTSEMGDTLQSSMSNLESFLVDNKELSQQVLLKHIGFTY